MTKSIHERISDAAVQILRPLVRILLLHGMAYGVFAEIARRVFVEEAGELLRRSSQRPTVSGIAAQTGLTRKEVSRLRDSAPASANDDAMARYSRAIRVITGWVNDADFQDAGGEPASLPLEGEECSFAALVRHYSGDITPGAMLALLESSNNVVAARGHVTLLERAYIPINTPADKITILGADVAELVDTIGHNLQAASDDLFFQRKVSYQGVSAASAKVFRELSNRKSQALLEEYNTWLSHQPTDAAVEDSDSYYVAVGIYYIERARQE